jgi:hypothetical protein
MATSGGQENDLIIVTSSTNGKGKPPVDVEYTYTLSVKYQSNATEDFPCKALNKVTVPLVESTKCVHFESRIADGDINLKFVVAYQLKSREDGMKSILDKLSDKIKKGQVLGLIVVNTLDTTTPHGRFWDVENCDFAVYIVSQKVGRRFMEILKKGEPGEVSVLVQKISTVENPSVPAVLQSTNKTSELSSQSTKSRVKYPLHTQLEKYLVDVTGKSNQGVTCEMLVHVITHFRTFESQGTGAPDQGLKILMGHISQNYGSFPNEFLLHLVIVHRILDKQVKGPYDKTTLSSKYVMEFLQRMEELFTTTPHFVVKIVKDFITKSQGNIRSPWISDSEHVLIFEIIGNASKAMGKRLKEHGKWSSFGISIFWCM